MVLVASWGCQLWGTALVVLVAGRLQLGCLLRSGPWSLKPAVFSGRSTHPARSAKLQWSGVVEGQDTGSGVSKNGDHSRRTAAIGFYLLSSRQFSAHPKSSHARIDKRTARAARNTRCRYYKIGPLDHKMADNCVSLVCTNTVSSTITKLIKT